jgi:hypothetical protein
MDFGEKGVILTLAEARSFIRKPYIDSWGGKNEISKRHARAS